MVLIALHPRIQLSLAGYVGGGSSEGAEKNLSGKFLPGLRGSSRGGVSCAGWNVKI